MGRHPRHELDDRLANPVRFSLMAILAPARRAEFRFVRDELEITDSMLSKQVSALEQAGYVKVEKGFIGKRGRTWLSLTASGKATFERHLSALRGIISFETSPLLTPGSLPPAVNVTLPEVVPQRDS